MADEDKSTGIEQAEPRTAAEWLAVGRRYTDELRLTDAAVAYERATIVEPNSVQAWEGLGRAQANLQHFSEALASLERALALRSRQASLWAALGSVYRRMGRYEEALEMIQRALAIDATFSEALYGLGLTLKHQGKLDQALEYLQQAQRQGYDPYRCLAALGDIYSDQGQYNQALASYSKALAYAPTPAPFQADLWYSCAITLLQLQRFDEALDAIDRAIQYRSSDMFSWLAKMRILRSLHRWRDIPRAWYQVFRTANYRHNPHRGVVRE